MKKKQVIIVVAILVVLGAILIGKKRSGGGGDAMAYPSKTIEIVVPSKAGGSTDAMARIFAEVAKKHLEGSEFVIVNKPGSGGQQGFEYIASAEPDGYTIGTVFTVQLPSHVVSGRARYKLDDFYYLGMVLDDPSIIVVPKDSPYNTLEELIEAAGSTELTASVNGIGSDDHLALMLLQEKSGVQFLVIPASGSTEQKASVMGGHVDVAFMNLSQMVAQHKAGEVKILALLADKRNDALPEIRTAAEIGFDVDMRGTRGFVIQKDVPQEIKDILDKLMADVVNDPAFSQTLLDSNQIFAYKSGPDYEKYMNQLFTDMEVIFAREPW